MTTTIPRETVECAANDAGLYLPESIREDYSGRGMYGATCFGLVVDCTSQAVKFLIALARNLEAELADELADNWSQDNMGLSTIVYFPRFQLEADRG